MTIPGQKYLHYVRYQLCCQFFVKFYPLENLSGLYAFVAFQWLLRILTDESQNLSPVNRIKATLIYPSIWSTNESLDHISNHHHGSKIKLPIHQHLMDNSNSLCCFKKLLGCRSFLLVGWLKSLLYLRILTTTKQKLLSC